jgi:hypothetical protein
MQSDGTYWERVVHVLKLFPCRVRVKWSGSESATEWEGIVFSPVPGYLETGSLGPVHESEVEWIEVDPLVPIKGRFAKQTPIDHSDKLSKELFNHCIRYETTEHGFRIYPQDWSR